MPGARPLPLAEVVEGRDYAVVLTTPGGLWRYSLGDVVRFVGTRPPRLEFVGRTRLELSAFGEHVIEHEVVAAMAAATSRFGMLVRDFTVAPLFPEAGERTRGRHQWFLDVEGPKLPAGVLSDLLDRELRRRNDDYRAKREGGGLLEPEIVWVARGAFDAYLASRNQLGGQHKVPRLRSDRQLADALLAKPPASIAAAVTDL